MAVFSALKPINKLQLTSVLKNSVRWSGDHFHVSPGHLDPRQFPMRPSVFQWRKFKDALHWYTMLGLIPLAVITTYINIVVGPAELTEIPEGYEPYHWEYYKSPISRFFAKHLIRDKRIDYEMMVSVLNEESERLIMRSVERQVKEFMSLRQDYQSWYYRPIYGYILRRDREDWKRLRDQLSGGHAWLEQETHFSDGGEPDPAARK